MAQNNECNLQHVVHNVIIGSTNNQVANVAPSATAGVPFISQGASADPIYSTGVVAGGFTGAITFTPYAVICAGTTSTGVFQNVSGVGTLAQVLTSSGAGALPTWTTLTPATSTFIVNKYTSSTTWTKDANTKVVEVIVWGGGGGGGSGRRGANGSSSGGGGGSGGYAVHMIVPQEFFAASETVTIGGTAAGGGAQTVDNTNGKDGTPGNNSSIGNVLAIGGDFGRGGNSSGSQTQAGVSFRSTFHITLQSTNQGAVGATSTGNSAQTLPEGLTGSAGGGGGGFSTTAGLSNGGKGGDILDYLGVTTIISGGTGGVGTGTTTGGGGTNFAQGTTSRGWLAGGSGGGGSASTTAGVAGNAGAGGTPSGGGGGGAGSATGHNSGIGGQGARGEIWVIEYS